MSDSPRTALVTGATSGLGFEAAVHLAENGHDPVMVTGRTADKAEAAAAELSRRTGRDVFRGIALDLGDPASVDRAANELIEAGAGLDVLLLNAGMVAGSGLEHTPEGIEIMMASSLIGHHRLTMALLGAGVVRPGARIVISGSEAARGDVPTFTPADLPGSADRHFGGDLRAAAVSLIRHDGPIRYKPANQYATAKLFVAYWAAALSRALPEGTTVNAVSPGSAPGTQAIRNGNFFMRRIMVPVMKRMPGMAADVPDAARRYVDAVDFGPEVSGRFFASAPKKMTGALHDVTLPHVLDQDSQDAAWSAIVEVAGVGLPATV